MRNRGSTQNTNVQFISQLSGQFQQSPVLVLSLLLRLFSMAGVPSLVGFFAQCAALYTAIHNGFYSISIVVISASAVSDAYDLQVVQAA